MNKLEGGLNSMQQFSIFDMLDIAIAEILGVELDFYIEKIESTTDQRAFVIIGACMSEDSKKIEKARKIFNML